MMQWIVTTVSNLMNRLFLSPQVLGVENLHKLAEIKREQNLGIVFLSNHLNANDPFIETGFLPIVVKKAIFPITFLATQELHNTKIKDFCMRLLGCIPVGNGSGQNVREVIKRIKNGDTIYLFPEGKVSLDNKLGKDKGLLEALSKFSDIIVQPVLIEGLMPFWDIKNMLTWKRQVHVSFGVPFVLSKGSTIDAVEVIRSVQKKDSASYAENMAT